MAQLGFRALRRPVFSDSQKERQKKNREKHGLTAEIHDCAQPPKGESREELPSGVVVIADRMD